LFVCTANICRSPVAAALLLDRLQKAGKSNWQVSSAGTWAMVRRGAAHNSILVMAQRGLDISDHVARMVDREHVKDADLVLCMEIGHAEALRVEFPEYAKKVYLLSEMVGKDYSIADPFGGPYIGYQHMAEEVTDLIDRGLERIIALAEANLGE
jgi:protein-tyrosine-phosphatase